MSKFQNDSIYWIEVEKIKPNPYQPRKSFSDEKLNYLAESIRQYGVLQPLVVTRKEVQKGDGGLVSEYELIAGERRLRASKIAGLAQIPAIIRTEEEEDGMKLELAIIENIQREDLNPIDRAMAFQQLIDEFKFKHNEIAKKVGKSREYVSNSLRLLALPEEIKNALSAGQVTEGHARPLLMLKDRPEEQQTLYKEIIYKKITVREAEKIARKVAVDKVRKKEVILDPELAELEEQLTESLGTRVYIEKKETGGQLKIDYFSNDDLRKILDLVNTGEKKDPTEMLENYIKSQANAEQTQNDAKQMQNTIEITESSNGDEIDSTDKFTVDSLQKTENEQKVSIINKGEDFVEQPSATSKDVKEEVDEKQTHELSENKSEEKGFLSNVFDKKEKQMQNEREIDTEQTQNDGGQKKEEKIDIPNYTEENQKQEKENQGGQQDDLSSMKDFNI